MKAIALTYDYDLEKMKSNGRFWADKVYSKDVSTIFKYSAASYATFLHHNPDIPLELYTNDVEMLKQCVNEYNVNTDKVSYIDYSEEIKKSKEHHYIFQPLVDLLYNTHEPNQYRIRIDNDLIWKGKVPQVDESNDVLIWKFERFIKDGNPAMGEILVCETVCNNIDFKEYNVGVLGYPKNYPMQELYDTCNEMSDVDIISVSDLGTHVWHVCEQTAESWIFHKYDYNVIETVNFVDHHTDDKLKCLEDAKYLLK